MGSVPKWLRMFDKNDAPVRLGLRAFVLRLQGLAALYPLLHLFLRIVGTPMEARTRREGKGGACGHSRRVPAERKRVRSATIQYVVGCDKWVGGERETTRACFFKAFYGQTVSRDARPLKTTPRPGNLTSPWFRTATSGHRTTTTTSKPSTPSPPPIQQARFGSTLRLPSCRVRPDRIC